MTTTKQKPQAVVAREAIVVNVGARAPEYDLVWVTDNKTGERVQIQKDEPSDPGEEGVPYAFKAGEKVMSNHVAVLANPGAFISLDEAEDIGVLVE